MNVAWVFVLTSFFSTLAFAGRFTPSHAIDPQAVVSMETLSRFPDAANCLYAARKELNKRQRKATLKTINTDLSNMNLAVLSTDEDSYKSLRVKIHSVVSDTGETSDSKNVELVCDLDRSGKITAVDFLSDN